jgi:hypothetical protein
VTGVKWAGSVVTLTDQDLLWSGLFTPSMTLMKQGTTLCRHRCIVHSLREHTDM